MGVTLLHVIKSTQSSECPHWSHRKELCFGVAIPHASVRAHRAGLWPVVEAADVFGFLLLLYLAVAHSPLANPSVLVVKVAWTLCNKVNLLAWIWCGAQAFSYYDVFLSLPVLTGRAMFHVDALSFSQPGCRGASFDQRTWSVPCLCTHRDTDEFFRVLYCGLQQVTCHLCASAILQPTACSIYLCFQERPRLPAESKARGHEVQQT